MTGRRPPAVALDVDGTLYPVSSPLGDALRDRLVRTFLEVTGLRHDAEGTAEFHRPSRRYGLALRGLVAEYGADPAEVFARAHALDHGALLTPDPALAGLLGEIPGPVVAFSNSPAAHVEAVLDVLGLRAEVPRALGIEAFPHHPKPDPGAFAALCGSVGRDPRDVVLVDDGPSVIAAARDLGMVTVAVGAAGGGRTLHEALGDPAVRLAMGLDAPG